MDVSRFFMILCSFLLMVCLVFSITALVSLRNVVEENRDLQSETVLLIEKLKAAKDPEKDSVSVSVNPPVTEGTAESNPRYCLKSTGGVLVIYTDQGEPVRRLDTQVRLLPSAERKKLETGIFTDSWQEMLTLIQDYGE